MEEFFSELKAFSFTGRINRLRYWKYSLCMVLVNIVAAFIMNKLGIVGFLSSLINLALSIIFLPFNVRRVHDLNKSGLWLLLGLIPIINFFFLIYICFFKGTTGNNDYGADPLVDYEAARTGYQVAAEPQGSQSSILDKDVEPQDNIDVHPKKNIDDIKATEPQQSVEVNEPQVPIVPVIEAKPEAPKTEPSALKAAVCPNCGAPIENNSKFCGNCGSKL